MTIVVVRFFGLARPLARYLDRLVVARPRTARARPHPHALLRSASSRSRRPARGLPPRRAARSDGRRRRRAAGPLPPRPRPTARRRWSAGLRRASRGHASRRGGWSSRSGSSRRCRRPRARERRFASRAGRRQGAARGELTAELVEILRGAPELVAYGHEESAAARIRELDAASSPGSAAATRRRRARRGALLLVAGLTLVGVLAVACSATTRAARPRAVATLALLAVASFDAVAALPAAARELSATLAAGRRVLELTDREPAVRDPASRSSLRLPLHGRAQERHRTLRGAARPASRASTSDSTRAGGSRSSARAARARPPSRTCSFASWIRRRAASRSPAATRASTARRTCVGIRARGPGGARLRLDDPREPPPRPPGRLRGELRTPCAARGSTTGSPRSRTGSTRSSARTGRASRAASASA